MAEITRQRQGELTSGVAQILTAAPDGLPAKDVLAQLRKVVPPTAFEAADYPNRPGVGRYDKIVRFSTIPLVKAGWLVKSKGTWSLTEEGAAALVRHPDDPKGFMLEAVHHYREWKKGQPEAALEIEGADTDAAEASASLEEAEEAAFSEIRAYVDRIAPYDFQDLVAALLEAMGYHVQWVSPPGPDRGVDIIAGADPLGIQDPRIKVQTKHRTSASDVSDLRAFMAVLGPRDVGIYVSTGGFTKDAWAEARSHESRRLTLLDLGKLLDLWTQNYERVEEIRRRLLPLKAVHFLALTPP